MPSPVPLAQISLYFFLLISFAQTPPPQSTATVSKVPRIQMQQEHLCCSILNFVKPIYPKESRLARTEGLVKLILIIDVNGSAADVRAVSGDPALLDSVITAVRQWRFQPTLLNNDPAEAEVPLSFTFRIENPPKPAYLYLKNGGVIRADRVREFPDTMEYTVGRRIHNLSADSVLSISACGHNCVAGGVPSFDVIAIPLLPTNKTAPSNHQASP
jgi:TonB family protein